LHRKTCVALACVAVFCSIVVQPALGEPGHKKVKVRLEGEYPIEFEAEASGPFGIVAGWPGDVGPPPPVVAMGTGWLKLDGDAAVDDVMDGVYFEYPAALRMDGEIKGEFTPLTADETWRIEVEFWNLGNAGAMLWPEDDLLGISYSPPPEYEDMLPCGDCTLEIERLDGEEDDEVKLSGEVYLIAAGPILNGWEVPYESFFLFLAIEGDPVSIIFTEHPDVGSIVDVDVRLDLD
jgi:hypothetical protein